MVWMIWKMDCTQLTASIQPSDWDELMLACPDQVEAIHARVQLTRAVFQHPANPTCYLISLPEQDCAVFMKG